MDMLRNLLRPIVIAGAMTGVASLGGGSPSFAQPTPPIPLACSSIELYDRFGGDFQKFVKAEVDGSLGEGKCELLPDPAPPYSNLTRVEKSEAGYLCVRATALNSPRWPHCYWTDGSKLRYIGHVPQLSEEQFAEVERLLAESSRLNKIAKGYTERADDLTYDGNERRHLDRSQQRQVDEFNDLYQETTRQSFELQHQAMKIIGARGD
jgi:hypothetical protein